MHLIGPTSIVVAFIKFQDIISKDCLIRVVKEQLGKFIYITKINYC